MQALPVTSAQLTQSEENEQNGRCRCRRRGCRRCSCRPSRRCSRCRLRGLQRRLRIGRGQGCSGSRRGCRRSSCRNRCSASSSPWRLGARADRAKRHISPENTGQVGSRRPTSPDGRWLRCSSLTWTWASHARSSRLALDRQDFAGLGPPTCSVFCVSWCTRGTRPGW